MIGIYIAVLNGKFDFANKMIMRKLSAILVVLLGTLSLGFSSQTLAKGLFVNWVFAVEKTDCMATCGKTGLKYPTPTGIDRKIGKPSFFICATEKKGWRAGFNKMGENTCTTVFDDKVHHGSEYFCQCTNNPRPKIFR